MALGKLLFVLMVGVFVTAAVPYDKTPPTKTPAKAITSTLKATTERSTSTNKSSEELRAPKKFPLDLVERACDVVGCDSVAEAFAAFANTIRRATSGELADSTGGGADSPETTAGSTASPTSGTGATGNNEMCFDRLGCFAMGSPWMTRGMNSPEEIDTLFKIYTRDTPSNEDAMVVSPFDADPDFVIPAGAVLPEKTTFFLVHGFNDFGDAAWLLDLKDAILGKLDANVVIVDWKRGAGARINYMQVAANTRIVAAEITGVVKALSEWKIRPQDIHIIGHSLGSHIGGYVGKTFDGAIGRITALDPAQPGFEGHPSEVRLAQSDALFVDVVHTNAAPFIPAFGLGMMGAVGDVDFFVNGGAVQPGCLLPPAPAVTSLLTDPVNVFGDMFACSHKRAMTLFTEAVRGTCVFWGKVRKYERATERKTESSRFAQAAMASNLLPKPPSWCSTSSCVPMGLYTPHFGLKGNFDVTTTAEPPFCKAGLLAEPLMAARKSSTPSLLQKLYSGGLEPRSKRSRDQADSSILSWFRFH